MIIRLKEYSTLMSVLVFIAVIDGTGGGRHRNKYHPRNRWASMTSLLFNFVAVYYFAQVAI